MTKTELKKAIPPAAAEKLVDLVNPTRCLLHSAKDLLGLEQYESAGILCSSAASELDVFVAVLEGLVDAPPEVKSIAEPVATEVVAPV